MTSLRPAPWSLRAACELELRRRETEEAVQAEQEPAPEPEHPGISFYPNNQAQELFAAATTDIAIIGGSVFGGKTWALTYEPSKHLHVPGFESVTFRRVTPEIRNPGGLWQESLKWYPLFSGQPREGPLEWRFPAGSGIKFAGLQYDNDVLDWKSSQICLLQFDQLEEFSAKQFWYMLSRNRSTCGVRPYVRASCNPDPDSFLAEFLAWWIDQDTGYAIPERNGKVRWFVRLETSDDLVWADSKEELIAKHPKEGQDALSVTFILARLQDNAIGNEKDPTYLSKMRNLPLVDRERLLGGDKGGNWKIRATAGLVFNSAWFEIVDAAPRKARRARGWDNAATTGAGDWSVGTRVSELDGVYYVEHVYREQVGPDARKKAQRSLATSDGVECRIRGEQEPGSAGVDAAAAFVKNLNGFIARTRPSTGSKLVRAQAFAAQAEAGNVKLIRAPWNTGWLRRMEAFPSTNEPDDEIDSVVCAYEELNAPTQDYSPGAWGNYRQ